ncbi:hypothetical protein KJ359_002585 [Pestalotiopsis sp. 9143b]|nr:hypothetical protein KJ359_002585 [Pestalotiopsis sp. 9143b]
MPSSKDKLELGLASYKSGNLVEASRHFRHAAKSCQCQIGNPKLVCTCADFLAACNNGTLGDLLRQPCTCPRRASKRCTHEPHCVALAHLAIICVKTDGTDGCKSSLVYAENLVRIAPRDPRGYLRLGQALRRLKKQNTALAVYRQGIALVARVNPQHQGLAWLQEQEKILSKQLIQLDPLQEFPPELLVHILSSLDTRTHWYVDRIPSLSCYDGHGLTTLLAASFGSQNHGRLSWRAVPPEHYGPNNAFNTLGHFESSQRA